MKVTFCFIANVRYRTFEIKLKKIEGRSMETMSFRFGIEDFFYYNKSSLRKNVISKDMVPTESINLNKSNEGGRNK